MCIFSGNSDILVLTADNAGAFDVHHKSCYYALASFTDRRSSTTPAADELGNREQMHIHTTVSGGVCEEVKAISYKSGVKGAVSR